MLIIELLNQQFFVMQSIYRFTFFFNKKNPPLEATIWSETSILVSQTSASLIFINSKRVITLGNNRCIMHMCNKMHAISYLLSLSLFLSLSLIFVTPCICTRICLHTFLTLRIQRFHRDFYQLILENNFVNKCCALQ